MLDKLRYNPSIEWDVYETREAQDIFEGWQEWVKKVAINEYHWLANKMYIEKILENPEYPKIARRLYEWLMSDDKILEKYFQYNTLIWNNWKQIKALKLVEITKSWLKIVWKLYKISDNLPSAVWLAFIINAFLKDGNDATDFNFV